MPASPTLSRIVYVSETTPATTETDLHAILSSARMRNRRLDVTGLLLRGHRHFLQVLEGRPDALDDVMRRVEADPRHRALRVLLREPAPQRDFGDWSMALVQRFDLDDEVALLHRDGARSALELRRFLAALGTPDRM